MDGTAREGVREGAEDGGVGLAWCGCDIGDGEVSWEVEDSGDGEICRYE